MDNKLEPLFRLIDESNPALVTSEDFDGPACAALRAFDAMGFLGSEPGMNPSPSCPYCRAGTPYRLPDAYFCGLCRSAVDPQSLLVWCIDVARFLHWFASEQNLEGETERIDESLVRLGTLKTATSSTECFYARGPSLTPTASRRVRAFRRVLILHGRTEPPEIVGTEPRFLSLADTLTIDGVRLSTVPLASFIEEGGEVRFDVAIGSLSVGGASLGVIPAGTREFAFIECLYRHIGTVVPYADLKEDVCHRSGSRDSTDEATFCHKRKSRLKRMLAGAPIDELIVADRYRGGYALRESVTFPIG